MAAMPADLIGDAEGDDPPLRRQREEFIKCQTIWCRHNLGVRLPAGRVHWNVPVIVDFQTAVSEVECPCCGLKRTWQHYPSRRYR